MLRRAGMCLLLMGLVLFAMSCTKISRVAPQEGEGIAREKLEDSTSIPPKFGKLISVSNRSDFTHLSQLWFQDEDGNVRMVVFNMNTNRLLSNAWLFPQK